LRRVVDPSIISYMFCPGCGSQLAEGGRFCGGCGYRVPDGAVATPVRPATRLTAAHVPDATEPPRPADASTGLSEREDPLHAFNGRGEPNAATLAEKLNLDLS
jgi:hypothetical protein